MSRVISLIILSISLLFLYNSFEKNENIDTFLKEKSEDNLSQNSIIKSENIEIIFEKNIKKNELKVSKLKEQNEFLILKKNISNQLNFIFYSKKVIILNEKCYNPKSSILNIELNYNEKKLHSKLILTPQILNYKNDIELLISDNSSDKKFKFEKDFLNNFEEGFKYNLFLTIYEDKIYIDNIEILTEINFMSDVIKIKPNSISSISTKFDKNDTNFSKIGKSIKLPNTPFEKK